MGSTSEWAWSAGSDFDYGFGVSFTDEELASAPSTTTGTPPMPDPDAAPHDLPGTSAFALQDGRYSTPTASYARGGDALWACIDRLDQAPFGRNGSARRLVPTSTTILNHGRSFMRTRKTLRAGLAVVATPLE